MFGVLFWIFMIGGLIVAALGFTSTYRQRDDRDGPN
ncbi:hypothetical protein HY17_04980 [Hyphomonas sp. CY54-11-8]|nr:hypothetical protein HY17_04980 [Hyphomonas sp. CY54-11-8]RAN41216.1 hypothetical protein HY26_10090 [Hyphomonas sp. GM-8P]